MQNGLGLMLTLSACLVACSGTEPETVDRVASTGASLTVDYYGDTDVIGFHFEVTRVSCDGEAFDPAMIEANIDLVDGIFPSMIEFLESTLDPSSRHLGSDFFVTLDPGCYDILVTPAAAIAGEAFTPSADCKSASVSGVEVFAEQTTDVTLLSQCVGDPIGGLDVLVLLNHPPEFSVEIDEKFNYECEPVEVCATITDPDDDPVEVVWSKLSGPNLFGNIEATAPVVEGFAEGRRIWKSCATITTELTDSYAFMVEAYDLASDGVTRIETLVAPEESHAELTFPIYTNWIEEPLCFDDDDELVPVEGSDLVRAKGCSYVTAEDWYCSGNYPADAVIAGYVCDGTDLLEEKLYPECD